MDGLLRSKKSTEINVDDINELYKKAFNFESNVVFFPVRHHSPLCSYHIIKTIENYKPDAILIEGPENASELIDYMVSEKTKPPFCIYLSYDDKTGEISEEHEKYCAFYPFLEYSPELVSLKEGRKKGLHCEFIDLSYGEKLLNTPRLTEQEIKSYGSDRTFIQSDYYKKLTEELGCKNFNELWEMLFEIEGYYQNTYEFVRNLFFYCYYSRENTSDEDLLYHGDIIREYYMFENIKKNMKKYNKILVVTGGIHTISLINLIDKENDTKREIKKIKKQETSSYLMPYSFEESDQNNGYESGMVFPFFYQKVWENILKNRKKPFEETVLRFIINTANTIRKKQSLSIADEMQSFYMSKGLSELREKKECGVFELIDAVKSSFVKGESNALNQPSIKNLYRLLTGMEFGCIDPDSGVPPIVNDFNELCRKFKIQTNTSLSKSTKLDIYNNEQHREKSYFFHQMNFLNTNFCSHVKGNDVNNTNGRILLRETWEYRYSANIQVVLISNSVYGATIKQACFSLLSKELTNQHNNSKMLSKYLLKANYMGIDNIYKDYLEKLKTIVGDDVEFISVMECFMNLCSIKDYSEMVENNQILFLNDILEISLNRIFTLMYTITKIKKEDEDKICDGIKFLYNYFIDNVNTEFENNFIQNMFSIYNDVSSNGALSGISTGILLKKDKISLEEMMTKFNSYIDGSEDIKKMSASFLKGFFRIAKDIIFVDNRLIESLNNILKDVSGNLFLEILPDLRLAFTYFLPFETDKIAKQVSSLYNVSQESILYSELLNQEEIEYAVKVDKFCRQKISKWFNPDEKDELNE